MSRNDDRSQPASRRSRPDLPVMAALGAGVYAIVAGAVTLLGWALDIRRMTDWINTGISMFPNTAVCAALNGVALILLATFDRRLAVRVLGLTVAVIGGLTLFQHVSGMNLGIDTLLFSRPWGQRAAASLMRMGPPASTSFLILGSALILATGGPGARRLVSALAVLPVAIASLSLIGYWFGSDKLYTIVHLTGIAFQTSTVIAALGIGLMAAVPEYGLVASLSRNDSGGMLFRRLLLPIVVMPLVIGWLLLLAERAEYFDTAFGLSMMLVVTIAMLLTLLAWTANDISRAAEATRQSQAELEAVLRRDINDRKQTESALREREQRYELVLRGAEAGIWDWNVVERRVMYSPRWKQLRGLADADVSDSEDEWSSRIHPDDYERVMAAVRAHFEGHTPVFTEEYRVRHQAGHWVWVLDRGIARRDESGRVVRMAGSETDITEQKRAEQELRRAEERMRSVVDHVVDGIITIDQRGNIESLNPAAEKLFGYQAPEVLGQNVKLLMPEPYHSQHDSYLQNYLTTGVAKIIGIGREVVGRRKDGSTFPMELAVSTFRIGAERYFTGIVRDVTERKQLESELRLRLEELADKNRRKNEFLATLAHELRNPLAPIRNSLQILRMTMPAGSEAGPLQEIMERQVGHMVRLVDDLLEVSRITSGKIELRPEPVDLAAVLHSAVETSKPLIESCGHSFSLSVPQEPLTLVADPVRLSQVVANLLNNAAKYTEAGGKIWLSAARHDGEVVISVRDTGVGISPAMLPRLFLMFTQADRDHKRAQGGLGIGLALAKNLVEMQGGRIEARSEGEGRGAEFLVHLPLGKPPTATLVDGSQLLPARDIAAGMRVLVVDDNEDAASSLAMLLSRLGNDVQMANDGPAALETIQSFKPAVVILDLGMPGMSGYEVAEHVQSLPEGRSCVLVALTGWGQEEDRRRTEAAGFKRHLVKPVEVEALQSLLAEVGAETSKDATSSAAV